MVTGRANPNGSNCLEVSDKIRRFEFAEESKSTFANEIVSLTVLNLYPKIYSKLSLCSTSLSS